MSLSDRLQLELDKRLCGWENKKMLIDFAQFELANRHSDGKLQFSSFENFVLTFKKLFRISSLSMSNISSISTSTASFWNGK